MTPVVVDTDVVSFIFKNHPISRLYETDLAGCTLLISFMTVAELDRWAIQSKWGPARRHDVPLVTHNPGRYQGVPDLRVISKGE
jgi:predicted nucleic acid-binding protein